MRFLEVEALNALPWHVGRTHYEGAKFFPRARKTPQLRTLYGSRFSLSNNEIPGDSAKQKDCMSFPKPGRIAAGPALATASRFATGGHRSNRTLREAITLSSMTVTALMCALPLRQVLQQGGWTCARSPILLPFVLLLVGWVAYAAISRTRGDL
jgi:hypothetical protein